MAKWLASTIMIATAYCLTGQLGLLLAVPPNYASAAWPASGIALAAMLILGYRAGLGVFLGAFIINASTTVGSATNLNEAIHALAVTGCIALGVTLQAVAAAWLIQRSIGSRNPLIRERDIIRFLAYGGPIACVIGSTWGVLTLYAAGQVESALIASNWWTWWVGDVIGVIIFTPLVLIVFSQPRAVWRPRRLSVALPLCVAFFVAALACVYVQVTERHQIKLRFERSVEHVFQDIHEQIVGHLDAVHALKSYFVSDELVGRREFKVFNQHLRSRHVGIQALEWLPRVRREQRPEYEARARDEGLMNFSFTERDASGNLVEARERDEYFPVFFVEPHTTNEAAVGFDVASNPDRHAALIRARDSGRQVATSPVTLVQETEDQAGFLVFDPVYAKGQATASADERSRALEGYVLGVFRVGDIIQAALRERLRGDYILSVVDQHAPADKRVIYVEGGDGSLDEAGAVMPISSEDLHWSTTLDVAERHWRFTFQPTAGFYAAQSYRYTWLVLVFGLSFTGLLGTFLLVLAGRTARVEDLYENAPDMFISFDLKTQRVTECNKTFLTTTGFSKADIIGRHLFDLYHPDCLDDARRSFSDFLGTDKAQDLELRLLCADGDVIDVSLNVSAACDEDGRFLHSRSVLRDITAKKQADAKIRNQEIELAHIARLSTMGELATGLAHEINQPLGAIAAYAQGAAMRIHDDDIDKERLADVLNRISANSHRAGEVVRRLRRFVCKREPERTLIDVNELITEAVQFIDADARRRSVAISFDFATELPPLQGDSIEIQQVMFNLIRNGCDAMEHSCSSDRRLVIRTRCGEGDSVHVDIVDRGQGLPPDMMEQVFEAFFTSKEDGLGMGLAISRSIVESHGGRIWATANSDRGVTFHLSLPVARGVIADE